jgi:hypothetical protein
VKKLLLPLLVVASLSATVVGAAAAGPNAEGCHVSAPLPGHKDGSDTVVGHGHREGCKSRVGTMTVKLVVNNPVMDIDLVTSMHVNVLNKHISVDWTRPDDRTGIGWNFYSVAQTSSGQYARSAYKQAWP